MFVFNLDLCDIKYVIQSLSGNILLRSTNLTIKYLRKQLKCDNHIGIKLDRIYDNVYQIVFIDFKVLFPDAFDGVVGHKSIDLNYYLDNNALISLDLKNIPKLSHLDVSINEITEIINIPLGLKCIDAEDTILSDSFKKLALEYLCKLHTYDAYDGDNFELSD